MGFLTVLRLFEVSQGLSGMSICKRNKLLIKPNLILLKFVVDIFCDVIIGALDVISNGGDGHIGQDGGDGAVARGSGSTVRRFSLRFKKFEKSDSCKLCFMVEAVQNCVNKGCLELTLLSK